MRRWLNITTGIALSFIMVVGIWRANPETLKDQSASFLLDGSNGVSSTITMFSYDKFVSLAGTFFSLLSR
jgi:hypothetical protein